ncbi:MAG: DnaJ domain-containing protein [Alicyclobacillus shizuokensis]|nr:DnaJ domain-containing protein [Alicyclobacillus shizuokensis]
MGMASEAHVRFTTCPLCQAKNRVDLGRAQQAVCGTCKRPLFISHYDVLNLSPGASAAEIRQQYRRLVQVWHPDKAGGEARADRLFQTVLQAYRTLSNPDSRRAYDALLQARSAKIAQGKRAGGGGATNGNSDSGGASAPRQRASSQGAAGQRGAAARGTTAASAGAGPDEGQRRYSAQGDAPGHGAPMDTALQVVLNALVLCAAAVVGVLWLVSVGA